ncbi:hypothetical protein ACJX0J_022022 [Zea mays]
MEHIKMVVMANRDHFHPQLHLSFKMTIGKLWQHINHSHDIIVQATDDMNPTVTHAKVFNMDINQKMTIETSTCLFDPLRTDGKEIIIQLSHNHTNLAVVEPKSGDKKLSINFGFQFFKCLCKIIINCEYASEYLQKSATKPLQYVTSLNLLLFLSLSQIQLLGGIWHCHVLMLDTLLTIAFTKLGWQTLGSVLISEQTDSFNMLVRLLQTELVLSCTFFSGKISIFLVQVCFFAACQLSNHISTFLFFSIFKNHNFTLIKQIETVLIILYFFLSSLWVKYLDIVTSHIVVTMWQERLIFILFHVRQEDNFFDARYDRDHYLFIVSFTLRTTNIRERRHFSKAKMVLTLFLYGPGIFLIFGAQITFNMYESLGNILY